MTLTFRQAAISHHSLRHCRRNHG